MKKLLFLLLLTSVAYAQVPADASPIENVQITNNVFTTTAPFINAQETTGVINKINKTDLIDVIEVSSATTLPTTGTAGKIYVTLDNSLMYRWNGSIYIEYYPNRNISQFLRYETTFASGSQTFTLPNNYYAISNVIVQGVSLSASQYTLLPPNQITINDVLDPNDYIVILYGTNAAANFAPYYTQAQNDAQLAIKLDKNTAIVAGTNTKITYDTKGLVTAGGVLIASDIPNIAQLQVTNLFSDLGLKAPLLSPTFTGVPTAPTAVAGTNTTQLATTAFVAAADVGNVKTTGNQTISGTKTINGALLFSGSSGIFSNTTGSSVGSTFYMETNATAPGFYLQSNTVSSAAIRIKGATGGIAMDVGFNGANAKIMDNGDFVSPRFKGGIVELRSFTVATLPTGVQGDTAFVTNALNPTYLSTVVGGGTVVTPVFYNGTNWVSN